MLVSNLVKIDKFTHSAHKDRTPKYTYNSDPYKQDNNMWDHPVYSEYNLYQDPEGRSFTSIIDMIINKPKLFNVTKLTDLLYGVTLEESEWNKPQGKLMVKSRFYMKMKAKVEAKLNCQVEQFVNIITDYIGTEQSTPYLCLAQQWIKIGRKIELLDLILEYTYGLEILRLMKTPSYSTIGTDNCAFKPMADANGNIIDIFNLKNGDAIPMQSIPYCNFSLFISPIEEINGKYLVQPPPQVFFSGRIVITQAFIGSAPRNSLSNNVILPSLGLGQCICSGGMIGYLENEKMNCIQQKGQKKFNIESGCCQICQDKEAICQECNHRDIMFCTIHSSLIKTKTLANLMDICYWCESYKLSHICNECFLEDICHCVKCSQKDTTKRCAKHTVLLRNIHGAKPTDVMCLDCQPKCICLECHQVSLTSKLCSTCLGIYCKDCNLVVYIDISPGTIFTGTQRMIALSKSICTRCISGRSIKDIQNEERERQIENGAGDDWFN